MLETIALNNDWEFTCEFKEELLQGKDSGTWDKVRLPHTVVETPFHYFDESVYQMVSAYRKVISAPVAWKDKRVFVKFDGIAHGAYVYLNGELMGEHHTGYTAFEVELTEQLKLGQDNVLLVKVDSNESQNTPPFGFVIDYMTYGGIYREAELVIREQTYMADVFVKPIIAEDEILPGQHSDGRRMADRVKAWSCKAVVETEFELIGVKDGEEKENYRILTVLKNAEGEVVAEKEQQPRSIMDAVCVSMDVENIALWDVTRPYLYDFEVTLTKGGKPVDSYRTRIGFRVSEFRQNGYYLNGRKLKIRGLNRHQSYPYVGYAMPKSIQEMDADVLRFELGLNAVRTSHYPQSQHFISRCDEIGLLVFTEIPGWQHIGDAAWKEQAYENVTEMITQYRNHPSIILWGVRINESMDDDEFYTNTNAMAHALDETRQTGGVRYIRKSHLLEDVYTYNDFIHDGTNQGCDKKSDTTPDMSKPFLITEYNGHMYPTKTIDDEEHRRNHALRHAKVLDAVRENVDICGSFGWCMADYNTHKDFGSGDRICYHGVLDMFRNPKQAAAVYASCQKHTPILEISSSMDVGEHPIGHRGEVYIYTNADRVKMYKNDHLLKVYTHADSPYPHLKKGPILVDDYVGDMLETVEGFDKGKSKAIKDIINYIANHGLNNISPTMKVKMGAVMTRYRMKYSDAVDLYFKYLGNWGDTSTTFRFEAIQDGKVVKTVTKSTMTKLRLEVTANQYVLNDKDTYDVAAIRVKVTDEFGNVMPVFDTDLELEVSGPLEVIGPKRVRISGGMGGTYVKTTGTSGKAAVTIRMPEDTVFEDTEKTIAFTVETE